MAKRRVQIVDLPKAQTGQQVGYGLYNRLATMGGLSNQRRGTTTSVNKSMGRVADGEEPNLEAEGGETVMVPGLYGGIPTHFNITGPRHAQGGVAMNLPEDSFIFSDFVQMRLKDPDVLNYFGKTAKKGGKGKGYTPADIAKQYDINKYIEILNDPNSDDIDKTTAEIMIQNYNLKLGALGLIQESQKGFEDGVPIVSMPYMDHMGITEKDLGVQSEESKQLTVIIEQMLQKGLSMEEIIAKLITEEIPPEVIIDALVGTEMSEEEAIQLVEGIISELMNETPMNQEQMPQQQMQQEMPQEMMDPNMMSQEPMSPEMMLHGGRVQPKLRRLKRAQEGGMPPEMMQQQGPPQGQAQGQDPMAEVIAMVEQMLQQGAELPAVIFELINMQVPEQLVAEVLMQLGVPEQEIQQAFEIAMSHPEMQQSQEPVMDPAMMQGQGMTPDMMPAMDPTMMRMGGYTSSKEPGPLYDDYAPAQNPYHKLGIYKGDKDYGRFLDVNSDGTYAVQRGENLKNFLGSTFTPNKVSRVPLYARVNQRFEQGGMQQETTLEEMIAEALQQGAEPQKIIDALVKQGLDPQRAQQSVQQVAQMMMGQQPQVVMQRGGSLKKYQKAGQVPKKYRTDKRYNIKDPNFTYAGLKKGDYINLGNGKFQKINVDVSDDFTYDKTLEGDVRSDINIDAALFQLAYFKELSKNPKLKKAFHKAYMESIKDKKLFTSKKGTTSGFYGNKDLEKVTPDELIDIYTKHIETNANLYLTGLDATDFTQNGKLEANVSKEKKDRYKKMAGGKDNPTLQDIYEAKGLSPKGIDIAKSQAGQWAYQKIAADPDKYIDDPELLEIAKATIKEDPSMGVEDEVGTEYGAKVISPIDGYLGNTTIGHLGSTNLVGDPFSDEELEEVEEVEEDDADIPYQAPRPWVDLGMSSAHKRQYADALSRRNLPPLVLGQPDVNMRAPDYVLKDWRGMQFDTASDYKQGFESMAANTTNPAVARASMLAGMGKLADTAGKFRSDTLDYNVAVQNQFSPLIEDVYNKMNIQRGTLWDKNLGDMNQRRQEQWLARQKSQTDAINVLNASDQDKAYRAALMYNNPQQAINPDGLLYYHNSKAILPDATPGSDIASSYEKYFKLTGKEDLAVKLAELERGKGHFSKEKAADTESDDYIEYLANKNNKRGGEHGVHASDLFPFWY